MIISCPNCKKQFKIDNSLITDEGRNLQCGSCNHVWFYKPEDDSEAPLTLNQNISISNVEQDTETRDENLELSKKLHQEKTIKSEIKNEIPKKIPKTIKKSTNKLSILFSYLIVFIITIVALIILVDTIKTPLINVFPGLEIILFNLFETLQDIKLFTIDLI